jgi:putative transposase
VLSQSSVRALTETLSQAYEALRRRALRGYDVAYLFIETVSAPLRRWGRKTGGLCGWGLCVDGRKVWLTLATPKSASDESWLEGLRALSKRGLQPPVTSTTDGAPGPGVRQGIAVMGPPSVRMRWWCHTMHNGAPKVPPQAWPTVKALGADRREAPTFEAGPRRCKRRLEE